MRVFEHVNEYKNTVWKAGAPAKGFGKQIRGLQD